MLDPLQCPRIYQAVDHVTTEITYTTRKKSADNDQAIDNNKKLLSIVDYDPAQLFVNEIRVNISKYPLLFVILLCILFLFRHNLMNKLNFFTMNSVVLQLVSFGNHQKLKPINKIIPIMLK